MICNIPLFLLIIFNIFLYCFSVRLYFILVYWRLFVILYILLTLTHRSWRKCRWVDISLNLVVIFAIWLCMTLILLILIGIRPHLTIRVHGLNIMLRWSTLVLFQIIRTYHRIISHFIFIIYLKNYVFNY